MPEIEKKIWITADKRRIPIGELEESHLLSAFLHCCTREFEANKQLNVLYGKINTMQLLKRNLIEEAEKRGITLQYPDQKFPSEQWGQYFEAERKVHTMPSSTEHS